MEAGFKIPDPCVLSGLTGISSTICNTQWCRNRLCPLSYNGLYSIIYTLANHLLGPASDLKNKIIDNLFYLRLITAVVVTLPYLIIFICLFFILAHSGTISMVTAIILTIFLVILVLVIIYVVIEYTVIVFENIYNDAKNSLKFNNEETRNITAEIIQLLNDPEKLSTTVCNNPTIDCKTCKVCAGTVNS